MTLTRVVTVSVMVSVLLTLVGCFGVPQSAPATSASSAPVPEATVTPIPATEAEQGQVMADSGISRLDKAGLRQVYSSGQATFDISDRQLLRADVGLGVTDYVPDIAPGELITFRLIGPSGTLEERTDRVRFSTFEDDPNISTIYYFLTADTPEKFFEIIRRGANVYGFDQDSVERWIATTIDYPNRESEFVVGVGYALGFEVSYEVSYKGPGHVNVVTVTVDPYVSAPRW